MKRITTTIVLLVGCRDPAVIHGADGTTTGSATSDALEGLPELGAPCALDPPDPTRLLVTTTDFSTGAVSVADLRNETVARDIALGSTDAVPFWHGTKAYIVHRHGMDYVDVLDPAQGWASVGEYPVDDDSVPSTNPHCIAFDTAGLAHVVLFNVPAIAILDLSKDWDEVSVGRIDLGGFADADGNPEASHCVACGDIVFVNLQRLDPAFEPRDHDQIAAIDLSSRRPHDLDAERPGLQGIELLGDYTKQLRRDPSDPDAHTLLALTTGIERIDLKTGEVSWAVDEASFAAAGIDHRHLPQSFDVSEDGTLAYVAAYEQGTDFEQVLLFRVGLDDNEPLIPEPFAEGFDSVERTLEVVGNRLWYGSTRTGEEGMWIFDLDEAPPARVTASPLTTGLPPFSLIAIP
jgi:hypothetical protein